jgi:phosphopantetheinyl transferase (holo-ACP synthase)
VTIVGSAIEEVTVDEAAALVDDDSVFTTRERADLGSRNDPLPGFAARLAAKRAVTSASPRPLALCDIEIVSDDDGRPTIELGGDGRAPDDLVFHVSLSHDDGVGVAVVVIERRDSP